jgi:drug/metabolite transporter (DMT)-like permease
LKIQLLNRGTFAAVLVASIWGLSFVAASIALRTISPILLATIRFIIASLLFLPVIIRGLLNKKLPPRRDLREMAFLGLISISIYFLLQYTGVKFAGAGISALITVGFIPILTGLASSILLNESLESKRLLGVATGFTGVGFIVLPSLIIGKVESRFYLGVLCLFGNAVCFSIYSTLSKRLLRNYPEPVIVTSYVMVFGSLALLPMSFLSDWSTIRSLENTQWISIFYLALVCSGLAYYLWNYALSEIDAVQAATLLYLEPVAAFLGSFIIDGTVPGVLTIFGGVLVILGAILTSIKGGLTKEDFN